MVGRDHIIKKCRAVHVVPTDDDDNLRVRIWERTRCCAARSVVDGKIRRARV